MIRVLHTCRAPHCLQAHAGQHSASPGAPRQHHSHARLLRNQEVTAAYMAPSQHCPHAGTGLAELSRNSEEALSLSCGCLVC